VKEALSKTYTKPIMTVEEVAKYLRLSQAKVYRLANAGEIPAMRIGKSWRFRKDMIDEWFHQHAQTGLETYHEK
jgi:excisionase family DNA binding protein